MNKGIISLIGFLLFLIGFLALALNLVGIELAFLMWLNEFGKGTAFLIKMIMIVAGIVMVIITRSGEYSGQHEEYLRRMEEE